MHTLTTLVLVAGLPLAACTSEAREERSASVPAAAEPTNIPPLHPTNIVSLALASEDHTTLVTAIKAAKYVTSVAASGPLTVFAPTNAAFEKLPPGTVETLLRPENVDQLREILKYHVTTSALDASWLKDGQKLAMANGAKATIGVRDGEITINGANVVASVRASNGMLHVIDAVLLPPEK